MTAVGRSFQREADGGVTTLLRRQLEKELILRPDPWPCWILLSRCLFAGGSVGTRLVDETVRVVAVTLALLLQASQALFGSSNAVGSLVNTGLRESPSLGGGNANQPREPMDLHQTARGSESRPTLIEAWAAPDMEVQPVQHLPGFVHCLTIVVANKHLETGEVAVGSNSVNSVLGRRNTRKTGKSTAGICALRPPARSPQSPGQLTIEQVRSAVESK